MKKEKKYFSQPVCMSQTLIWKTFLEDKPSRCGVRHSGVLYCLPDGSFPYRKSNIARPSTYLGALICIYSFFALKIKILTVMLKLVIPVLSPLRMEMLQWYRIARGLEKYIIYLLVLVGNPFLQMHICCKGLVFIICFCYILCLPLLQHLCTAL